MHSTIRRKGLRQRNYYEAFNEKGVDSSTPYFSANNNGALCKVKELRLLSYIFCRVSPLSSILLFLIYADTALRRAGYETPRLSAENIP